ncbi:hypothetical protein CY34DRAFT_811233, partial [Suillus luteus UH-Slu-Lm8-n1]
MTPPKLHNLLMAPRSAAPANSDVMERPQGSLEKHAPSRLETLHPTHMQYSFPKV